MIIKLIFKIKPDSEIAKLYNVYLNKLEENRKTIKEWMNSHKITEWYHNSETKVPSSVNHPLWDSENYKWIDVDDYGASRRAAGRVTPPVEGLINLKKNSIYQYSPDRKGAAGKAIVKLWNSWKLDQSDYKNALKMALNGQSDWPFGVTARGGNRIHYASIMSVNDEAYVVVPRSYDKPFKKHRDLVEIKGSALIKQVSKA